MSEGITTVIVLTNGMELITQVTGHSDRKILVKYPMRMTMVNSQQGPQVVLNPLNGLAKDINAEVELNEEAILLSFEPNPQAKEAFENTVLKTKANDKGIVLPGQGG